MIEIKERIARIKTLSIFDIQNYLIMLYAFSISMPQGLKRVLALLMIFFWLFDKTKMTLPKIKTFTYLLMFITFSVLSILWSQANYHDIIDTLRKFWVYLPLYIIYRYLKKEYIWTALNLFLSGVFISEILSYGNFFGLWQVGYGSMSDPTVFSTHTQYSILLAVAAFVIFIRFKHEMDNKKRVFLLFFLTTVTLNLFVNGGRTGQIAFLSAIILYTLYYYGFKIKYIVISLLSIICIFFTAYTFSPIFKFRISLIPTHISNVLNNHDYTGSIGARIGFYLSSKDIIIENPLFGTGIANHIHSVRKSMGENNMTMQDVHRLTDAHNQFLEYQLEYGLVGLSLFILILYSIFRLDIKDKEINSIKFTTLVIFIIGSQFDILFNITMTESLFVFIIGIVFAQYRAERRVTIESISS